MTDTTEVAVETVKATVHYEYKHAFDGTYDNATAALYFPVDITGLDPSAAEKQIADALNGVKAVVLDALGVDYEYVDGVLLPVVKPAVPVVKQASSSKYPPKATSVAPAAEAAFGGGSTTITVCDPDTGKAIDHDLPDWVVEKVNADFPGGRVVKLYYHEKKHAENRNHPLYKTSKTDGEKAIHSAGAYWPPK